jgi:CHAT domain-containing protein/tetratricopeptide (TPR) repeat protein
MVDWKNMFGNGTDESLAWHDQQGKHISELEGLGGQAYEYYQQGQYRMAITTANREAIQLVEQGQYDEAIAAAKLALLSALHRFGKIHPNTAMGLAQVATIYRKMGKLAEAAPFYRQSVEVMRAALGEAHPHHVSSLANLATLYEEMGDYVEAIEIRRQELEIRRNILSGQSDLSIVPSLNNLADLHRATGEFTKAERLYRQAAELIREALGRNHPYYARALNELGLLYKTIEQYDEAERLYRRSLEIMNEATGEDHPDYATVLNNLGSLYRLRGNYAGAEQRYRQALEILGKVPGGKDHPRFVKTLNNLAELHWETGDYDEAERLYKRAANTRAKILGENHPDVARDYENIARVLEKKGSVAGGVAFRRLALDVLGKAQGEDHPDYAHGLRSLATSYRTAVSWVSSGALGPFLQRELEASGISYAAAEHLYQRALEIMGKDKGDNHLDYARILFDQAMLHLDTGNYEEAERLLRRALEIEADTLGQNTSDYADSLVMLAHVHAATHREAEAARLEKAAAEIHDHLLGHVFSVGTEVRRMAYLGKLRQHLGVFLSLALKHRSRQSTTARAALDLVLRRKAIGVDALATQREAVLGGKYPELASSLQELRMLQREIAQMILAEPGSRGSEGYQQILADKNSRRERLEADLVSQIPEMNLEQYLRTADRQAVAEKLPKGYSLVEFVRFEVYDFDAVPARGELRWRPARYLAFVLQAGKSGDVRMVDLGEAEPIDRLIATFRNSITREGEDRSRGEDAAAIADGKDRAYERDPAMLRAQIADYSQRLEETRGLVPDREDWDVTPYSEEGVSLREAVFDKLVAHLSGRTRLFLAPDGDLSRLPFEALPTSDGQCLIDEYQISYLGSGRDVLRFDADSAVQAEPPLVAADPDFDLGAASVSVHSNIAGFKRLSGTRKEGQRIAQMLGVTPLVDEGPLEDTVKNARSPRILHIATHGFFRPDAPRDPNEEGHEVETMGGMGGLDGGLLGRLAHVENPLLRSGLALVGANTWLKGGSLQEEAEDGILMAENVTGMDLLATELVVLSACQTGLGEVHSGEGVYGLRRAFVLAGANTLVMSLWKVPDEQTRELMEDFYRRLLRGTPRAEALRKAQLAMKKKHPDPFYWGAFICQGDPSSLPG